MDKRQQYIQNHSRFFIVGYRKLITLAYALMFIVLCLMGIIIYQHMTRHLPKYFVTTIDGRLVEIHPLNQ